MRELLLSAAVGLLASSYAFGDAPVWTVMEESRLDYSVYLGDDQIGGEFTVFDAHIQFDPEMLATSHFIVSVEPSFVDSRDATQDDALRGSDFFAIDMYPESLFEAHDFQHIEGNRFEGLGQLTIRNQTHPLTLPFTFTTTDSGATLEGDLVISRLDYGVGQGDWSLIDWLKEEVTVKYRLLLTPSGAAIR